MNQHLAFCSDIQTFYVPTHTYRESVVTPLDQVKKGLEEMYFRLNDKFSGESIMVVHGGDLFEKPVPHASALTFLIDTFQNLEVRYPNIHFVTTSGNHDQKKGESNAFFYGKPYTETYLDVMASQLENFEVVDANAGKSNLFFTIATKSGNVNLFTPPYFIRENDFLNYLTDCQEVLEERKDHFNILVFHQDFEPCFSGSTINVNDERFRGFDRVLFGHIHSRPEIGSNFLALGSLFQMKAGDADGENAFNKGFYTLEDDNQFIFNPMNEGYPRFHRLERGESIPEELEGHYIKWVDPVVEEDAAEEAFLIEEEGEQGRLNIVAAYSEATGLDEEAEEALNSLILQLEVEDAKEPVDIKFHKISIQGIQSIADELHIDLDKHPLTFYVGPKGSGKSTAAFHALYWGLTGSTYSGSKKDEFITSPDLQKRVSKWMGTRVMIEVTVKGYKFVLARHSKFKGETFGIKGKDTFLIFSPEEEGWETVDLSKHTGIQIDSKSEADINTKQWQAFTGITPNILKTLIIFDVYSTDLISAKDSERTELFNSMLDLNWTKKLDELIKQNKENVRNTLDELANETETLEMKSNSLWDKKDTYTEIVNTHEDRIKELDNAAEDLKEQLLYAEELLDQRRALIIEDPAEIQESIEGVENTIRHLDVTLASFDSNIEVLQNQSERLEKLQTRKKEAEKRLQHNEIYLDQLKSDKEVEQKLNKAQEELAKSDLILTKCGAESEELIQEKASVKSDINVVISEIKRLTTLLEESVCPECLRPFDSEGHEDVKEKTEKQLQDFKEKLTEFNQELTEINDDINSVENSKREARSLRTKSQLLIETLEKDHQDAIRDAEANVKEKQQEISLLNNEIEEMAPIDHAQDEINTLIGLSEESEKARDEALEELESLKEELKELLEENRRIENLVAESEREVSSIKRDLESKLNTIDIEKQSFRDRGIENNISNIDAELGQVEVRFDEIDAEVEAHNRKFEMWDLLTKKATGSKGVGAFATRNKLKVINECARKYGQLVGQTVEVSLKMTASGKVTYDMSMIADHTKVAATGLSGGQTAFANMIWMFALNDYYRRTVANPNILILDEPIKPASGEEDLEKAYKLLETLNESDLNLHVIAHPNETHLSGGKVLNFTRGEDRSETTRIY